MRLYAISCTEYYEDYGIVENEDDISEELEDINPIMDKCANIEIKRYGKGKKPDIAYCWTTSDIVLLQSAYEKIADIFCAEDVELLQAKYKDQKCYIPHITKAYEIPYYEFAREGSPYDTEYKEEDIINAKLNEKYFFRLRYNYNVLSQVYYTEKFVDLLKQHELKGIEFEVVWDSEQTE